MFTVLMSESVESVTGRRVDRCVQTKEASLSSYTQHSVLKIVLFGARINARLTNGPQRVLQCDEVSGAGLVGPNRKVLEPQMDHLQ